MTTPPKPNGTIDITDGVEKLRSVFVQAAEAYLLAIPALAPIWAIPFVGWVLKSVMNQILDALSKWEVMQAFFLATAIRKASQAHDFVDAVEKKNSLPHTATTAEYEAAEREQMQAFRNFVSLTN